MRFPILHFLLGREPIIQVVTIFSAAAFVQLEGTDAYQFIQLFGRLSHPSHTRFTRLCGSAVWRSNHPIRIVLAKVEPRLQQFAGAPRVAYRTIQQLSTGSAEVLTDSTRNQKHATLAQRLALRNAHRKHSSRPMRRPLNQLGKRRGVDPHKAYDKMYK